MKKIALTMAVCLAMAAPAFANTPTGQTATGGTNSDILPDTNVRDGDGSGLGISETAPGDVDQANMGETGASGAVGTATGTTDSTMQKHKAKRGHKAMKSHGGTSTETSTDTNTSTETGTSGSMQH